MNLLSLSVKNRLYLLAVTSVLGLVVIGLIVASGTSRLQTLQSTNLVLNNLKSEILMLRRYEKDFLARLEDKYAQLFSGSIQRSLEETQDLHALLEDVGIENAALMKMNTLLQEYREGFLVLVQLQKDIGYNANSGLYGSLRATVHSVEQQLSDAPEIRASMLMLRRHEKDFMLRRDLKYVGKFNDEVARFNNLSVVYMSEEDSAELKKLISSYSSRFKQLVNAEEKKGLTATLGARGDMRKAVHSVEAMFEGLEADLTKEIESAIKASDQFLLLAIIIIAVLIAIITVVVALSISRPLSVFSEEIAQIIDQKDLTYRLTVGSCDELSTVAVAFNELLSLLHEMMSDLNDAAMQLASSAEEMSMVTKEVKHSSEAQTSEVEHAAVAVNEMSSTVQEIARNASMAADSVTEVHEQLKEGVKVSAEARDEIETLTQEVQSAAHAIQELEKNSNNIGQVLDAIQNVAEQTNLLALNAAIEAARAGEQGRGFAVVADEVRTLAQRTQESTETIRQTIAEFQHGTNEVVSTVSKSNQRAESGIQLVTRSSGILNEISNMVSAISDINMQIAAAAEEQGVTAEEISRNVTRVSDLSQGVKSQTQQTSDASNELAQLGVTLRDMVTLFKV